MLSTSVVSAGFFDAFFSEDTEDNNPIFEDMGVEGNKSSDWFYHKGSLKVSVTSKGTVLTNNGENNAFYSVNMPSTSMDNSEDLMDWDAPYTINFDLVSDEGGAIQITDGVNSTSRTFEKLGAENNSHIKIVNDGNTINYYINGVNDPNYVYDGQLNQATIRFVLHPNSSLCFKNFSID